MKICNLLLCLYTYLHRKSFLWFILNNKYLTDDERKALIERAKVHDMDKMLNYVLYEGMKKECSAAHRSLVPHHRESCKRADKITLLESIFDFECAYITKPDKPRNAFDTVNEIYPELKDIYLPELERLGMASSYIATSLELEDYIRGICKNLSSNVPENGVIITDEFIEGLNYDRLEKVIKEELRDYLLYLYDEVTL